MALIRECDKCKQHYPMIITDGIMGNAHLTIGELDKFTCSDCILNEAVERIRKQNEETL